MWIICGQRETERHVIGWLIATSGEMFCAFSLLVDPRGRLVGAILVLRKISSDGWELEM
jgi:hypothetical protein